MMTRINHFALFLHLLLIGAGLALAPALHGAEASTVPPMANGAIWKEGKPESLPKLHRPSVEAVLVFAPGEHDWGIIVTLTPSFTTGAFA